MSKIWICCFILNGCFHSEASVRAFETEIECQKYLEQRNDNLAWHEDGKGQCASGEYLLNETRGRHD